MWQTHSSNNDLVHSGALRVSATGEDLGCFVFNETTGKFTFFAKDRHVR